MAPSFDAWISDFEEILSPSTSGGDSFVAVSTNATTAGTPGVGASDGEYEGVAKRAHLFYFDTAVATECKLCLGFVGSGVRRFCIKPIATKDPKGVWTCGVLKHSNKFKPDIGTFYPKGNKICAYCEPAFPKALVPPAKMSEILTSKHTIAEWAVIFKEFEDAHAAFTGRDDIGVKASFDSRVPLKTPAKRSSNADDHNGFLYYTPIGLKAVLQQPDLGNDILADWVSNPPAFLPPELSTFIRGTRSFLLDYEEWWKRPISEAFDMLTTTKDDLYLLKQACERLLLSVGKPATIDGMDFPDIWTALEYIGSTKSQPANTVQIQADLESLKDVVDQLPTH